MNIRLVKLSYAYRQQLVDMMDEWLAAEQKFSPASIRRNDHHDFEYYLSHLEFKEEKDGHVPDSVFFCLDVDRNIFVGAINIRHYLNEHLLHTGGHIGDGIRPSQGRKGYATAMIRLGLEECRKLGIERVLITCDKDNIGSAKSILNNGGVLENEVYADGIVMQRYWVDLRQGGQGEKPEPA
ncbi:MAG: GNAT family N-acetyltransferase [Christensenellales bacterium]